MSIATPALFGRITAVQRDHTALLEMVASLRNLQTTLHQAEDDCALPPLYPIQDFAILLYTHFSTEESDAYFGAVVSERPSLGPRIDNLRSDHEIIVRTLANLPVRAAAGATGHELATLLGNVLDFLQAHERRENELMQDYLLRDEGVPGE
jgi:hemerythrin